ncbi:MAG: hypothetical protein P1V97_12810 [Planctomycetota bacterium]|nr:hypothetical protein [Planctomycetota bacterium]
MRKVQNLIITVGLSAWGFCLLASDLQAQDKGAKAKKLAAKAELRATVNRGFVYINVKTKNESILYSVNKINGSFYAAYTKKGGAKKSYRSKNELTLKKEHPAIYDQYREYRLQAVPRAIRDHYKKTLAQALKVAHERLPIDLKGHMADKVLKAIKLGENDLRSLSIVGGTKTVFTFAFDPNLQMSSEYFVTVTLEKGKMTGRAFAVS